MPFPTLNTHDAANQLACVGIVVDPAEITIEPRQDRWLVRLPNERLAWFAASPAGGDILRIDRNTLRLIEERCTFRAPRILAEHKSGDFDVRAMVSGASDPQSLHTAACGDVRVAEAIGASVGAMVSELHTKISIADVDPAIQRKPSWPESRSWILERLPKVIDDPQLIATADALLSRCEKIAVKESDRVLIHGDLGMHALAYDPQTFEINGLFDFEGAAIADRHHDFRYFSSTALNAALASYHRLTGHTLERHRVTMYGAACALSYLAFREGHPAEEAWCGRTFEEDLKWTREAMAAVR